MTTIHRLPALVPTADELATDRMCAEEWPCPTCGHRGRHHIAVITRGRAGVRVRSGALCPTCNTWEELT